MKFSFRSKHTRLVISVVFILILVPLVRLSRFLTIAPGPGKTVQLFDFEHGYSLKKIADELENKRIISSAGLFMLYARLHGDDGKLKAGTYRFHDGLKPGEVLRRMVAGEIYAQRFAVPEGYSVFQIGDLLEGRGLFKKAAFLKQCTNPTLLKELAITAKSVEGYLYPCTYDITPKMSEADFIRQTVEQFEKVCEQKFAPRLKAAGMSRHVVITLASMIEKEAREPSERPLIASVFHNRLKKGMRLQSDPTAVYGVRAFAGTVSKQDILRHTPYNTYLISGLPPGPIGNPGSQAIEAVLNPAKTDYLYFVAKRDGTHYFSATLEQHNKAVQTYLRSSATSGIKTSETLAGYHDDRPALTGRR
ncbi:MAG: hypothetical protein FD174_1927 [Geobacteraceae bacterium]|nr:MAG: hypothetical protein FD174_1927 [Geobacteraceae bacterium]